MALNSKESERPQHLFLLIESFKAYFYNLFNVIDDVLERNVLYKFTEKNYSYKSYLIHTILDSEN